MKILDKILNRLTRPCAFEHTPDLMLSDAIVDIINRTGCLNILNGSTLRIYDGPVPKSPTSALKNNALAWEWKGIANESKMYNKFLFTEKSALILYGEDGLVRHYKPTFFRLTACNEHDNCVVQGSVGYDFGKGIRISTAYLISGYSFTVNFFSLKGHTK